jgi:uncharacterized protein (DUF736 family)
MIIGNFKHDKKRDTFLGEITTLTAHRADIQIVRIEKPTENGPEYRLVCDTALSTVEFGAAWKRKSKGGEEYLSVSIDDPSLSRSINAALMKAQTTDDAILIWSRPVGKKAG